MSLRGQWPDTCTLAAFGAVQVSNPERDQGIASQKALATT